MIVIYLACEQAHLRVTRASGKERVGERSDPVGRSLVMKLCFPNARR